MSRHEYSNESLRLFCDSLEASWRPTEGSTVAQFYAGKCVLVTGATGFLGKLLSEKLLRACQQLDTLYLMVRPKKGVEENERMEEIYKDVIFGLLSRTYPNFRQKIKLIHGDIEKAGLGLSPEDRDTIINRVNVIFHIAATVRFDEQMTRAVKVNVRATRDLLRLAAECRAFASFVHVSTAYTNCNQSTIEERLYAPPHDPDDLVRLAETLPEDRLTAMADEMRRDWPNNYTFTKAVAEQMVGNYARQVPVCVYRPAIVIATYKEPIRSWIDNLYGATGILVGFGTGILKSMHCDRNKAAELVPADYVINGMIAIAYKTAVDRNLSGNVPVYNYVSSVENRMTWEQLMCQTSNYGYHVPTIRSVSFHKPMLLNKHKIIHDFCTIFMHFLPGYIMDLVMVMTGRKPMMVKIYKKINKFESVVAHFATMEWKFRNDNTQNLWKALGQADRQMFPFSMAELDWSDYHKTHPVGLRVYAVKDDLSTLDRALKKQKIFYAVYIAFNIIYYGFLFWLALKTFQCLTAVIGL